MSAIFDFPLSSETLAEDELTAITGTPMAVLSTTEWSGLAPLLATGPLARRVVRQTVIRSDHA